MLFITKYEHTINTFGGMVRVKDVERLVDTNTCSFLHLDFRHIFRKNVVKNDLGNLVHVVGVMRFYEIYRILTGSGSLYFHTVGNFIKVFPYLLFVSGQKMIIDLHGAQPEEFEYKGSKFKSLIFTLFERAAFILCDSFVYVSYAMRDHFENKYPHVIDKENYYVPIFSATMNEDISSDQLELQKISVRRRMGFEKSDVVFIYSGGCQEWQKIDEIKLFISAVLKNSSCKFFVLSAQSDRFKLLLSDIYSQHPNDLVIRSVLPNELEGYYLASDYGVMFRDENILNVVSSPTKLSEYLYYGIRPIFLSLNVGDFVSFGIEYESLEYNDMSKYCRVKKSVINHDIILDAITRSEKDKLKVLLNE